MFAAQHHGDRWVIFAIITLGWVVYFFANRRSARAELGSEVELAPNRKPYYDDETLEGPRLERVQLLGVLLLAVLVVALPLYWVFEPGRQAGATEGKEGRFVSWGGALYATTAEGGFNCAGCHGATAAAVSPAYSITDPNTGEVKAVSWTAPALNTVLYRFDESEVKFILVYGRPFSPMSPWGVAGGGPMNDQQIDTLIAVQVSIQIPRTAAPRARSIRDCPHPAEAEQDRDRHRRRGRRQGARRPASTRRSTRRWARRCSTSPTRAAPTAAPAATPRLELGDPGVTGQGAFGWNLTGGSTAKHFPERGRHDRLHQERLGVRQASTASRARAAVACPGSGRCSPTSRSKAIVEYVRSLCEPRTHPEHRRARRINWDARAPRHPHRHHRRVRADGQRLPDHGTNMGARLGFLVAFTGLAGWMFLMGAIWWSTASV
jgi:hypothetical protein